MPIPEVERLEILNIFRNYRENPDGFSAENVDKIKRLRSLYLKETIGVPVPKIKMSPEKRQKILQLMALKRESPERFANQQLAQTEQLEKEYVEDIKENISDEIEFDPEGEGYDYETAGRYGIRPDDKGHWPSREPETGLLLKGKKHPTFEKTIKAEQKLGYKIYKKDGRYYSYIEEIPEKYKKEGKVDLESYFEYKKKEGELIDVELKKQSEIKAQKMAEMKSETNVLQRSLLSAREGFFKSVTFGHYSVIDDKLENFQKAIDDKNVPEDTKKTYKKYIEYLNLMREDPTFREIEKGSEFISFAIPFNMTNKITGLIKLSKLAPQLSKGAQATLKISERVLRGGASGTIYGGLKKLEEGESRKESTINHALLFAAFDGLLAIPEASKIFNSKTLNEAITKTPMETQKEIIALVDEYKRVLNISDVQLNQIINNPAEFKKLKLMYEEANKIKRLRQSPQGQKLLNQKLRVEEKTALDLMQKADTERYTRKYGGETAFPPEGKPIGWEWGKQMSDAKKKWLNAKTEEEKLSALNEMDRLNDIRSTKRKAEYLKELSAPEESYLALGVKFKQELATGQFAKKAFNATKKDIKESLKGGQLYGGVPLPTEYKYLNEFLSKYKLDEESKKKIMEFSVNIVKSKMLTTSQKLEKIGNYAKGLSEKIAPTISEGIIPTIKEDVRSFAKTSEATLQKAKYRLPEYSQKYEGGIKKALEDWVQGGTIEKRMTKTILRKYMAIKDREVTNAIYHSENRMKWFDKQKDEANINFIINTERNLKKYGGDISKMTKSDFAQYGKNAEGFLNIAKEYHKRMEAEYLKSFNVNDKIAYIEGYFPHIWKNKKDAELFFENYVKKFSKSPAFMKKRYYELIEDGLNAGLELKYTNPERIILEREISGFHHRMTVNFLNEMKQLGYLKHHFGAGFIPKGWSVIDHRAFKTYAPFTEGGKSLVEIGQWIMPNHAARVIKNYLSKGFWQKGAYDSQSKEIAAAIGRGMSYAKNYIIGIKLGLSGFHAVETTTSSLAVQTVSALRYLSKGKITKGLAELSKAPIQPFRTAFGGNDIFKAWKTGIFKNDYEKWAVEMIDRGGGSLIMSKQWQVGVEGNFKKAISDFKKGNIGKGTVEIVPGIIEAQMYPLMQWYIPRLKGQAYIRMVEDLMHRKPNLKGLALDEQLQKLWGYTDNRFGQLRYENLFMNKLVRDIGVLSQISMGWNLGTIREFGGAGIDVTKFLVGKSIGIKPNILSDRILYSLIYASLFGTMGGMITYLNTGKAPEKVIDYYYPKTGFVNPDGTEERLQMPTMLKEFMSSSEAFRKYNIFKAPLVYGSHKLNPKFHMFYDLVENKDFYGTDIRDINSPIYEQAKQVTKYLSEQGLTPISISSAMRHYERTGKYHLYSFMGYSLAPGYVTKTPIQKEIFDLMEQRFPRGRTIKEYEEYKKKSEVKKLIWQNKESEAKQKFDQLKKEGIYAKATKWGSYLKESRLTGDIKVFKKLSDDDQLTLFNKMDENDIVRYAPYIRDPKLKAEALIKVFNKINDPIMIKEYYFKLYKDGFLNEESMRELNKTGFKLQ